MEPERRRWSRRNPKPGRSTVNATLTGAIDPRAVILAVASVMDAMAEIVIAAATGRRGRRIGRHRKRGVIRSSGRIANRGSRWRKRVRNLSPSRNHRQRGPSRNSSRSNRAPNKVRVPTPPQTKVSSAANGVNAEAEGVVAGAGVAVVVVVKKDL